MLQDLLNKAQKILSCHKEFYIPVELLWKEYLNEGEPFSATFEDFIEGLKKDPRFYIVESDVAQEEFEDTDESSFISGPWVGLKERIPSREEIKNLLVKKTENIISALQQAYKVKSPDPETEKKLLQIMINAKKIKEKISKIFEGKDG